MKKLSFLPIKLKRSILLGLFASLISVLLVHNVECGWIPVGRCGFLVGWPIGIAEYSPDWGRSDYKGLSTKPFTEHDWIYNKYFNPMNRVRIPALIGVPYGFKDWSWINYIENSVVWTFLILAVRKIWSITQKK